MNEIFVTVQGEGTFTGTAAVFVRLQGCPVGCPWCDTKYTWPVNPKNALSLKAIEEKRDLPVLSGTEEFCYMTPEEILDWCRKNAPKVRHVVVTGGEPALYDLEPLCDVFLLDDCIADLVEWEIQVETSGTHMLEGGRWAWVTVSPKFDMPGGFPVQVEMLRLADEIKFPVGCQKDIDLLRERVIPHIAKSIPVFLQPLSMSEKATKLCVEAAIANNWRVSVQTHKLLRVR